jgi:hypothetical protein
MGLVGLASVTAFGQTRLISRIAAGVDPSAIATKYKLTLVDKTANAPFAYFGAPTYAAGQTARQKMATDPQILWTEDDASLSSPENNGQKGGTIPAIGDRNALYERNKNVLAQIGWSKSLANSSGRIVVIAILDTGLASKQTYLWNKTYAAANFVESGSPFDMPRNQDSNGNGTPDEAVGHGTMVAGIVDQIAPLTRLAIARVADSDGRATAWRLIKGLAFAVNAKAEVANISLGSSNQIVAMTDVLDWCDEKNLLVVAAIGNNAHEGAVFPSRISKVICVSGLKPDNVKAPFSNWDGTADAAAPATGIVSQYYNGQMGIWSGTSFAAPMVSGAIADVLRRTGRVLNRSWRDYLKNSGQSINNANPSYKDRLGRLLNIAALNSRVASSAP